MSVNQERSLLDTLPRELICELLLYLEFDSDVFSLCQTSNWTLGIYNEDERFWKRRYSVFLIPDLEELPPGLNSWRKWYQTTQRLIFAGLVYYMLYPSYLPWTHPNLKCDLKSAVDLFLQYKYSPVEKQRSPVFHDNFNLYHTIEEINDALIFPFVKYFGIKWPDEDVDDFPDPSVRYFLKLFSFHGNDPYRRSNEILDCCLCPRSLLLQALRILYPIYSQDRSDYEVIDPAFHSIFLKISTDKDKRYEISQTNLSRVSWKTLYDLEKDLYFRLSSETRFFECKSVTVIPSYDTGILEVSIIIDVFK